MRRLLIAALLMSVGCAQSSQLERTGAAEELDAISHAADCATRIGACERTGHGEQVAEVPHAVIDQLVEAGRQCGARGGATIEDNKAGYTKLFWKEVDQVWRSCFQAAARSLGFDGATIVRPVL